MKNLQAAILKNGNQKLGQVFYKGVMVTVEFKFGTIIMTKGNLTYSECGKFKAVPKTLKALYNEMVKQIEAA